MSLELWVAGLVIPVAILLVDLGRRKLTTMRILRPFLATVIVVPFVMPSLDLRGAGLGLEAAGVVAGLILGLLTAAAVRVQHDPEAGIAYTTAGLPYAAIWIAVSAARLLFIYETSNSASVGRSVGEFLATQHIAVNSLADAIVFFGLAMLIANRASLFLRAQSARSRALTGQPAVA